MTNAPINGTSLILSRQFLEEAKIPIKSQVSTQNSG